MGFSNSTNEWLSTDLNYLIQEYLNQSVVEKTCVLKFTFVHNIVRNSKWKFYIIQSRLGHGHIALLVE